MDRLISEQAIVDVLSKGYWDKSLQSAKDDPCVIDAMIDWAIRQIKAIPSADMFSDLKAEISMYENSDQSIDEMIQGIKSIISIYER